jgi:prepilin-type processing-associated H-X9-DG protein
MNAQDMIDYALGRLDGPARAQAEQRIAADPVLADTLDRLGPAIHRLLDDGAAIEVPDGLARRTVVFVLESRRRRTILDFVPTTVPFRWADVAVAASIFLAGLLTLLPAAHRSKRQMDQAGCGFNLQQLGIGLTQYAAVHQSYPYASPTCPNAHAGTFAVMLHDALLLPDLSTLDCPCDGVLRSNLVLPDMQTMSKLCATAPERYRELLRWDYAYHVGFRDRSGRAGPIPALPTTARPSGLIPILADEPAHEDFRRILAGNSPNHAGRGQNVLFCDGHVRWHTTRRISPLDADLFLNAANQPGPGLDMYDAALMPSLIPFSGW